MNKPKDYSIYTRDIKGAYADEVSNNFLKRDVNLTLYHPNLLIIPFRLVKIF